MASHSQQPLTPAPARVVPPTTEEAKARLRAAAQNITLGTWVSKNRWSLLAVVVAGGFVASRLRLPTLLGSVLIQRAAPLLLSTVLGGCRSCSGTSTDSSLKSK